MCVRVRVCICHNMCRGQRTPRSSLLPGSIWLLEMGTQGITLSSKCIYPLNHLADPVFFLLVLVLVVTGALLLLQVGLELTMQPRLASNLLPQPSNVPKF